MKRLLLPLVLLQASCSPDFAELPPGTQCLVLETRGIMETPVMSGFTLSEADVASFNAWFRDNSSRFTTSCVSYAPYRSVFMDEYGEFRLTLDEKALVFTPSRAKTQAGESQYVLRLGEEDGKILRLLRMKD